MLQDNIYFNPKDIIAMKLKKLAKLKINIDWSFTHPEFFSMIPGSFKTGLVRSQYFALTFV